MFDPVSFIFLVLIGASRESHVPQGQMQKIGKQKEPDLSIPTLLFSPSGQDFYQKFVLSHQPVFFKGAALHWPLIQHLKNDTIFREKTFPFSLNQIKQESGKADKENESCDELAVDMRSGDKILDGIILPFILSCNKYLKKLSTRIHYRNVMKKHFSVSSKDQVIISYLSPFYVLIFDVNGTVSGEMFENMNILDVDVLKYPDVMNLPYQVFEVEIGDEIYIPAFTYYHLQSHQYSSINYIALSFELFEHNYDTEKPFMETLAAYKRTLSEQPPSLPCDHAKINLKETLGSYINFTDREKYPYLRIPVKNERPEDVLLASGYKMPVMGLGTALLYNKTYDAIKYALEIGYRMFDLAHGYPECESSFSKALSDSGVPRGEVFVVTKLQPRYLGYKETLHAIDISLDQLKTSYIDLYLIHSKECDDFLLKCNKGEPHGTWRDSWRAMEHAVEIGKIRSIGVSNFDSHEIYELLQWSLKPVSVVQNWFDPFHQDRAARKICSLNNIRYMGFSTLGHYWTFAFGLSENPVLNSATFGGLSNHYDYVLSHVVLRWAIHKNVTVIPRSANPNHIAQNFRSLDIKLYDADIEIMDQTSQLLGDDEEFVEEDTIFG